MSRLDVIVPCYNYGRFLRECVVSVVTQPVDLRVLIIDDASTDDTSDVAATLVARDHRIAYRRHNVNRGHIATFNEGLEWAAGDYTLLLSADDVLVEGALERAVRVFEDHPDVGLVYGRAIRFYSELSRPVVDTATIDHSKRIVSGLTWLEAVCSDGCNSISSPEAIVRTRILKSVGAYCETLPHTADMDMWMRSALHGSVATLNCPQAYYRLHRHNMSGAFIARERSRRHIPSVTEFAALRATFAHFLSEHANALPEHDRLESLARKGLAAHAVACAAILLFHGDSAGSRALLAQAAELCPLGALLPAVARLAARKGIRRAHTHALSGRTWIQPVLNIISRRAWV